MKKLWNVKLLLFLFSLGVLAGCGGEKASGTKEKDDKFSIVATTGMIADITKNVGGEHVDVEGLMGPGVDPHLYKATQGDIKKLEEADMIFYNGLHLEGKMQNIFEKIEKDKPTVVVTKNIDKDKLLSLEDNAYDPHVWFNVEHWISATDLIKNELIAFDPEHKEDYTKNFEEYKTQLEDLHKYATTQIASIKEDQRVLITAHDAFGYFGEAYGLEVKGLQGISTLSEYGSKDVTDLRNFIVENKIKAIFVESSVPKKAIQAVIEGARREGHNVEIGGELFSDAMGKSGTEEGTYIGMIRHNVDTITNALK